MDDSQERRWLERHLASQLQRSSKRYGLLKAGDKVMVAVSGGKDSLALLHLLHLVVRRLPFSVELIAVHLDQHIPEYDGDPLIQYFEEKNYPYAQLSEDTYGVVTQQIEDPARYCSLCARLRRGILYTAAERLGCNKIALGHHRDDTLQTLLLNLLYSGKLQAMPAHYTTDDGAFEVIRPLIECQEAHIARFAQLAKLPVISGGVCEAADLSKRVRISELLNQLEAEQPNVKSVMLAALKNVHPTHLLDEELAEAWAARPAALRPSPRVPRRAEHNHGHPVRSNLPLFSE